MKHPAGAAVFEQGGVAGPSHDGMQDALGPLVRERKGKLAQDHGFIHLVACGLFQHLQDEVEDEQAAQLAGAR